MCRVGVVGGGEDPGVGEDWKLEVKNGVAREETAAPALRRLA